MVASSINYPNYTSSPVVTKTTKTTVREFDSEERVTKETVTEVTETTRHDYQPYTTWGTSIASSGHTYSDLHTTYRGKHGAQQ